LRIIGDPSVAAMSYGLHNRGGEQHVLIYDLGGSTFDATVFDVDGGIFIPVTAGNRHLGGADFDKRVMDHLVEVYREKTGTDVSSDLGALGRLRQEVEKAKRTLSSQGSTTITIEAFENGHSFSETLTRAKFEELNMVLFLETLHVVDRALLEGGIKREEIDEVSSTF
jgi:heat shock protein 5